MLGDTKQCGEFRVAVAALGGAFLPRGFGCSAASQEPGTQAAANGSSVASGVTASSSAGSAGSGGAGGSASSAITTTASSMSSSGAGGGGPPLEVVQLSVSEHNCVLTKPGTVRCWGSNLDGQLGQGTQDGAVHMKPLVVPNLGGVVEVRAGTGNTCARMSDGSVRCWGNNKFGQLGDGTTVPKYSPTLVPALTGVAALALPNSDGNLGTHTCALKTDGTVWCWGSNQYGELGDGTTVAKLSPTQVPGLSDVKMIAVSDQHSFALKKDGTLLGWGLNTEALTCGGFGDNKPHPTPAVTCPGSQFVTVAAGQTHTCGIYGGGLECWGGNYAGELGTMNQTFIWAPNTGPGVVGVAAAPPHSHAWKADGSAMAWGLSNHGELGLAMPDGAFQYDPKVVDGLTGVVSIGVGSQHGCALQKDGQVLCWGTDSDGNLGSPPKQGCFSGPCNKTPVPVQF